MTLYAMVDCTVHININKYLRYVHTPQCDLYLRCCNAGLTDHWRMRLQADRTLLWIYSVI